MRGIVTDCMNGKEYEIEIHYEVIERDGRKIFQLINGVTGYESFYIHGKYTHIDGMLDHGWTACAGTKGKYDKLFIPAEDMKIALEPYLGNGGD